MLCEGEGVPVGLAVDGANRHDMKMAETTLTGIPITRPETTEDSPQNLCLDKGSDYNEVRELATAFGYTAHIRS